MNSFVYFTVPWNGSSTARLMGAKFGLVHISSMKIEGRSCSLCLVGPNHVLHFQLVMRQVYKKVIANFSLDLLRLLFS